MTNSKFQIRVDAYYEAAVFLKNAIENWGWKRFSSNYLREHIRCRFVHPRHQHAIARYSTRSNASASRYSTLD